MPKKPRAEAATVAARVEAVLRIRLDGAQFHDVLSYATEQGWNLTDRQVRNYVAKADDLLVERQEKRRRRVVAVHLARREALYARCVNAAGYRDALACLTDLAKLQGLYASDRDLKELVKLAAAQADRLRDLEARLDAAQPATSPTPPPGPADGPAGGAPPGRDGPVGDLPGGPGKVDG